ARTDLLDVLLGLALFPSEVAQPDLEFSQALLELASLGAQPVGLGRLGQVLATMRQLVQPRIQGLDAQQRLLDGRIGLQCSLPSSGPGIGCQGSVQVVEMRVSTVVPVDRSADTNRSAASDSQGHSLAQCATS